MFHSTTLRISINTNVRKVIEHATNQKQYLKLGWYCVRNRSTREVELGVSMDERDRLEAEFFAKEPWTSLKPQNKGVTNLLKNLRKQLAEHTEREWPV